MLEYAGRGNRSAEWLQGQTRPRVEYEWRIPRYAQETKTRLNSNSILFIGTLRQVPTDGKWSMPVDTKQLHQNLVKTASNILKTIKLSPITISNAPDSDNMEKIRNVITHFFMQI